jgi:cell division protease FtsH
MLLDEVETVSFLEKQLELMLKPFESDCSKSLIFIMGNLDEAYEMASNYNTDIDADTFHNESLKININHIKKALKTRFRNEQIARLGNNHIIYPAFNKDSFTKLINLELSKIQSFCKEQINVDINFDESVIDFAYEEGVFPTQGARPVYTTIQQMITSQIGNIVIAGKFSLPDFNQIFLKVQKSKMVCQYISEKSESSTFTYDLPTNLKQIRKNPCDDLQALIAVHESGHAVTSMLLLNIVPNCICSRSSNTGNDGFVLTDLDGLIINSESAKAYLAVLMGGIVAEKLMFGADMVTTGSSQDLKEATEKASSFIRKSALGSQIGYYSPESHQTHNHIYDNDYSLNEEIKQWLRNAYELAFETLTKHKSLLVYLSNHLSDQRIMEKSEIAKIYNQYLKNITYNPLPITFSTSYRSKLKMMDTESNFCNKTQYLQLNIQTNKNI